VTAAVLLFFVLTYVTMPAAVGTCNLAAFNKEPCGVMDGVSKRLAKKCEVAFDNNFGVSNNAGSYTAWLTNGGSHLPSPGTCADEERRAVVVPGGTGPPGWDVQFTGRLHGKNRAGPGTCTCSRGGRVSAGATVKVGTASVPAPPSPLSQPGGGAAAAAAALPGGPASALPPPTANYMAAIEERFAAMHLAIEDAAAKASKVADTLQALAVADAKAEAAAEAEITVKARILAEQKAKDEADANALAVADAKSFDPVAVCFVLISISLLSKVVHIPLCFFFQYCV